MNELLLIMVAFLLLWLFIQYQERKIMRLENEVHTNEGAAEALLENLVDLHRNVVDGGVSVEKSTDWLQKYDAILSRVEDA